MDNTRVAAIAHQLRQQRTAAGLLQIRRQLDKPTAQAVIRAVPPVERGAILLCMAFRSTDRWAPFDSGIIEGDPAELWPELGDS